MKRSLALSGAIHALVFLALLLGGLPRMEVSAPGVIQVLLLESAGGAGMKSTGPAAGDSQRLRRADGAPPPGIARAHPLRPALPSARRANRPAVETAATAPPPARMQRVAIAARRPREEGRTTGETAGATGEASPAAMQGGLSGQEGPASGAGGLAETPAAGGGS
jgi:hypothetical protein